jgi:hypothetical protein
MLASVVEHRIGSDDEPAGMLLVQHRESGVDLGFVVGLQTWSCTPFMRAASCMSEIMDSVLPPLGFTRSATGIV